MANSLNQPCPIRYLRRYRSIVEIRLRDRDATHTRIRGRNIIYALRPRKRFKESAQTLLSDVFLRCGNHDVTSLLSLVFVTELSPPWESFDLLQTPFHPENQNYIKQNQAAYAKGDCHNLINKSVNRTPPDTSAIQIRLLAFRESHCFQAAEENMASS